MSDKVNKNMTFHQVLQMSPQVAKVLGRYNLGCVGCMGAMHETLEQGAIAHGLDVNDILRDLNAIFQD
ncbi:MAG: DUF1858 domain-containing protein [Desulfuromonadales bacterium]|nr:DUF1858 domain-containing protein [Desulfuromonadales bacterium]